MLQGTPNCSLATLDRDGYPHLVAMSFALDGTRGVVSAGAVRVIPGVQAMPATMRSSMQKDVEQHKPPELDAIAGPILRGAQRHGIEVPATKKLVAAVKHRAGFVAELASDPARLSS